MTLVLRQLHKALPWEHDREDDEAWLSQDDLRGDVFKSLQTTDCVLSVYFLQSDAELMRALASLSATKQSVQAADYGLVDLGLLVAAGFEFSDEHPGVLPDPEVASWHRDIINLSAKRVFDLAILISEHGEFGGYLDQPIGKEINLLVAAGKIQSPKLNKKILEHLKEKKYQI